MIDLMIIYFQYHFSGAFSAFNQSMCFFSLFKWKAPCNFHFQSAILQILKDLFVRMFYEIMPDVSRCSYTESKHRPTVGLQVLGFELCDLSAGISAIDQSSEFSYTFQASFCYTPSYVVQNVISAFSICQLIYFTNRI